MYHSPKDFPRRILVAVCGLSPQILTETLYALAVAGEPRFVPTEIHLLTTREGAHRARLSLLQPETGKFHRLCEDYGLPAIAFDAGNIHVVHDREGNGLDDIRTPQENEWLADHIAQAIRQYTLDPDAALHVSIAGGRKTMGYYAGYALSLFGRRQDRLSHVLVTPDYESHPEFFYPTPASQIIHTRGDHPRPLDTSQAEVILAEIPFIRLRDDIPGRLLNGQAGFSETIDLARRAHEAPELVIDRAARELRANGIAVALPPSLFAFYLWVVTRTVLNEKPLPKPEADRRNRYEYAAEFQSIYEGVVGDERGTEKTDDAMKDGMKTGFFNEKIARINGILNNELGERLAQNFRINNRGRRGYSDYGIDPNTIQIHIA
ncbi:CRISPR-associated protein, NE0113 family [Methylomagnum ishizawai]|uniref:CRISPR-associated protein, NE0113 family n=1 Tax=Methylomagnum ishizawai TaxID=1760988 RepID=A0A1Y6D212_9GAMM|nr:CRISPR-associated ring nuclease Csm6 [Methylomagnum ishizawai]SMF96978.1 CRISPR-associated protein, NE0113 family [Methylomagnum ishizawai]